MGDLNLDFSKNPRFLVIPYGCAAIGAAATVSLAPALPVAAAIALGAVAGGIALPAVGIGVAVGAFALLAGVRKGVKEMLFEASMIPLGMAVVGYNCAKAMFVTPFQAAWKWMKSGDDKKNDDNKPAAKTVINTNTPKLDNAKAAGPFNANSNAKPATEAPKENKPPAPKPPAP